MNTWWWIALVLVVLVALIATLVDGRGRSPRPPKPHRPGDPQPGEIWWANVPFEDTPGAKDRPCLVLSVRGGKVRVAKITTKQHDGRPGVIPLPADAVGDAQGRSSYLETNELRDVRLREFRRRVGPVDATLWAKLQHLPES
ncbi:type II toxin-antitoxin system PemK/MazF family toxin [Streptomyces sp. NPDC088725]|uniref:type II toxin-antitoxin system PemK/MazF family toxin n=1 Tax=Streptomyces sp. NPDC088725 TaxID=3365873 RepID=UPI00380D5B5D